jgi:hypothetical protein
MVLRNSNMVSSSQSEGKEISRKANHRMKVTACGGSCRVDSVLQSCPLQGNWPGLPRSSPLGRYELYLSDGQCRNKMKTTKAALR